MSFALISPDDITVQNKTNANIWKKILDKKKSPRIRNKTQEKNFTPQRDKKEKRDN